MEKNFKTIDEQIEILKEKNLIIEDEETAKEILLRENYFFLMGYRHVFMISSKERKFIPGTTFSEVYSLFTFDRNFRNIIFKNVLVIENQLKSVLSYQLSKKYGYKEAMNGISYSACLLLLFAIVAGLLGEQDINYIPLTGELFGYMLSQMLNLSIYYYLLINSDNSKFPYLGAYVAAMLTDTLVSMLFASRLVILTSFWRTYFVTVCIEAIISIFLIYFDNKKVYNPKKK